ncbi:MAG: hypothetical protein KDB02_04380 [Acidimicrobiales bacterium]|nr:hypothetical protein [Acidimicrobiales bacterium]
MDEQGPERAERSRWEPAPDLLPSATADDPTVAQSAVAGPSGDAGEATVPDRAAPPPPPAPPAPPVPRADVPPPAHVATNLPPGPGPVEGPSASSAGSVRNRRLAIAAAVLAVVAAVVVAAVVVSQGGGDDSAADTTTTSTSSTTSTTVVQGEVELLAGVKAIVPPGSLSPGAVPVADLTTLPGDLGAMTPAGPVIALRIEKGRMLAPIRLAFTLSGTPTAPTGGEPVVVALTRQDGNDTFHQGKVTGGATTFEVEVDDVGVVAPMTWRWEQLTELTRKAFRGVAESDATSPADVSCADDLDDGEVRVSGGDGGVAWCTERDGTDRRVIAVNHVGFPVTVRWVGKVTATRADGTGDLTRLGTGFTSWTTDTTLTLSPGERASFVVASADEATFTAEVDDTARSVAALVADTDLVAAIGDVVPGAESNDRQEVLDRVDPACASEAGPGAGPVLERCFDAATLRSIFGDQAADLIAPLLAPKVLGIAVEDAARSVEQTMTRRAGGSLTLTARTVHEWPTGENDADPALLSWLDDIGETSEWARCVDDYCVAGVAGRVAVVQIEDGSVVRSGGVDLDVADPLRALTDIGIPESVADALTAA